MKEGMITKLQNKVDHLFQPFMSPQKYPNAYINIRALQRVDKRTIILIGNYTMSL